MRFSKLSTIGLTAAALSLASGWIVADAQEAAGAPAIRGTYINFMDAQNARAEGRPIALVSQQFPASTARVPTQAQFGSDATATTGLTLAPYTVVSSRDGNTYSGVIVGSSPDSPATVRVATRIVPMIIEVNSVATSISSSGRITSAPGHYTASAKAADTTCLTAPNDVPVNLVAQSPLFTKTAFSFGGTVIGTTQYVDAFMRGEFYNESHGVPGKYHLLLSPSNEVQAVVVNVPASFGVALDSSLFSGGCGTLTYININWFDAYVQSVILPALAAHDGVTPANLPMLVLYNTVLGVNTRTLTQCCILGYHGATGTAVTDQTYSVTDFESTGLFGPTVADTAIGAHELNEWANDPFGNNPTPAWGHTGQVTGCQNNLEVGDPLSGTDIPTITMPNGFTYHLQELAFFSWFYGAPTVGVNGWYSDNNTFTTDAGPPCT